MVCFSARNLTKTDDKAHARELDTAQCDKTIDMDNMDAEDVDFDSDFDEAIEHILKEANDSTDEFQIPYNFDISCIMEAMLYKKEVTQTHTAINQIINNIERDKVNVFVKQLFAKIASFVCKLTGNKTESCGIPEKNMAEFYKAIHQYSTGAEYYLQCIVWGIE